MEIKNLLVGSGYVEEHEAESKITARVKDVERICEKLDRHGPRAVGTFEELEGIITDIAGVRVVVKHPREVLAVVGFCQDYDRWQVDKIEDHQRADTGYRATHIDLRVKTTHFPLVRCELQVRTLLQDAWATWTHPFYEDYRQHLDKIPPETRRLMKSMSDLLNSVDEMADILTSKPIDTT